MQQHRLLTKLLALRVKIRNFDKVFLYVPIFIPDAKTQILFNVSNKNCFTLSFDSRSTDRKTVDTQLEYRVDIDGG